MRRRCEPSIIPKRGNTILTSFCLPMVHMCWNFEMQLELAVGVLPELLMYYYYHLVN